MMMMKLIYYSSKKYPEQSLSTVLKEAVDKSNADDRLFVFLVVICVRHSVAHGIEVVNTPNICNEVTTSVPPNASLNNIPTTLVTTPTANDNLPIRLTRTTTTTTTTTSTPSVNSKISGRLQSGSASIRINDSTLNRQSTYESIQCSSYNRYSGCERRPGITNEYNVRGGDNTRGRQSGLEATTMSISDIDDDDDEMNSNNSLRLILPKNNVCLSTVSSRTSTSGSDSLVSSLPSPLRRQMERINQRPSLAVNTESTEMDDFSENDIVHYGDVESGNQEFNPLKSYRELYANAIVPRKHLRATHRWVLLPSHSTPRLPIDSVTFPPGPRHSGFDVNKEGKLRPTVKFLLRIGMGYVTVIAYWF
ncbi:unnamed protein product [Trichobilharzia szidati]|nr:unnamed protein product [Trichobilharzia szidati]